MKTKLSNRIDMVTSLLPFFTIVLLCILFMYLPDSSSRVLSQIRFFLGDTLGSFYLVMGLFMLIISIYIAFSKYGNIRLGGEKPEFTHFQWGSMMFTAGLAADILFYSLCEWILYAGESHIQRMGGIQEYASVYPLFHWGPIPWSFYMVLAVAFGFMLHIRKRGKQKYSESLRPLIGNDVDGIWGKIVDIIAVFALIAGTATTFSLATPLLAYAVSRVTGIPQTNALTILILLIVCTIYTLCAYLGIEGVSKLANTCTYLFFILLAYIFFMGGESKYILETGIAAIGKMTDQFFSIASYTDPLRESGFPQNWTIFYWAYWMVWCVATPFFIGSISKGRTIRQIIMGGYFFGLSGTFISFIILGNYGLALQMKGKLDLIGEYQVTQDLYATIITVLDTLPFSTIVFIILAFTMITFYATTFDSLTLVASAYSYKFLKEGEEPDKKVKLFWAILLILLPIAFIFAQNSMSNLQTVSIIAAFPVGFIMIMIVISFFKDAKLYLSEK